MDLSEQEIQNLIKQAQAGDSESFTQIYNLFFKRIYKFIFFRTKLKEEAEDLTSSVFLKLWQNLHRYKVQKNAKFSTWLFQIARFTIIDHYRQQKVQISLSEIKEIGAIDFINKDAELSEIKRYLLLLPENYQTVINLRYFEDLSHKQIAQIMGKTSIGVRVLLHRALKRLANLMNIKHE